MNFGPKIHHRRSIRLKGYDYTSPGGYFITIVTKGRIALFGEIVGGEMEYSDKGRIAIDCWRAIPGHFPNAELGVFVVMPNHVHGIIILHENPDTDRSAIISPTVGAYHGTPLRDKPLRFYAESGSLGSIIRQYKSSVTRKIVQQFGGVPSIWQRNYYEHIIRDEDEHKRIHLYIESNPFNWMSDEENPEMRG